MGFGLLAICGTIRILPGMENRKLNVFLAYLADEDKAVLEHSAKTLKDFGIEANWRKVGADAGAIAALAGELEKENFAVVIAAGRAEANLPAMIAAKTTLPVLGVPMAPAGNAMEGIVTTLKAGANTGVASLAIGKAGAINAALQAIAIASLSIWELREKLEQFRAEQTAKVMAEKLG